MNHVLVTLASRVGASLAHLYRRESEGRDCHAKALHALCLFAGIFKMCANRKATCEEKQRPPVFVTTGRFLATDCEHFVDRRPLEESLYLPRLDFKATARRTKIFVCGVMNPLSISANDAEK